MVKDSTPTLWDDPNEPTWSVGEIGEAIGLSLRRAFPDEVWIRGVIRNLTRGRTGMVWFDLVEPAPGDDPSRPPVASLPVVLFDAARRRVNARLYEAGGGMRMTDGTEVRVRGRLTFYEPGGRLQLQMADVDPTFTLGRLAAERERLLRVLAAEGLLERQRRLPFPPVPLRVGLVTSTGSAAEHDALDELRRSGLGFHVLRVDARVQGTMAPRSIARGLRLAATHGVDVVLLVRGGGAMTDLAAFDSEAIARAIADLDVPVLTGIGHDIDRTLADEVAHAAHKTPTACAGAIVEVTRRFAERVEGRWRELAIVAEERLAQANERLRTCARHVALGTRHGLSAKESALSTSVLRLRRSATGALVRSATSLERATGRVETGARGHLRAHDHVLEAARQRLLRQGPRVLSASVRDLDSVESRVRALDPSLTLARGWSITRNADGRVVRAAGEVHPGEELVTTVAAGSIYSTVQSTDGREVAGGAG